MLSPRSPRRTSRLLFGTLIVASTLAFAACSSDDDDETPAAMVDAGEDADTSLPGNSDSDSDGAGDTSMPAPGTEPGGEVDMTPITYVIPLTTEEEIPAPTGAEGASGEAMLTFDPATRGMTGSVTTSGLSGPPTMAHIHEQVAGEETGPPIVTFLEDGSGTGYVLPDDTILTEEQAESLETGLLYVNVHTDLNMPGEIRGQIVLPDPDSDTAR